MRRAHRARSAGAADGHRRRRAREASRADDDEARRIDERWRVVPPRGGDYSTRGRRDAPASTSAGKDGTGAMTGSGAPPSARDDGTRWASCGDANASPSAVGGERDRRRTQETTGRVAVTSTGRRRDESRRRILTTTCHCASPSTSRSGARLAFKRERSQSVEDEGRQRRRRDARCAGGTRATASKRRAPTKGAARQGGTQRVEGGLKRAAHRRDAQHAYRARST